MIEFKIGQTVERVAPNGDKSVKHIMTDEDIQYHQGFQEKGYTYTVISSEGPRIYTGESVCVSCEG